MPKLSSAMRHHPPARKSAAIETLEGRTHLSAQLLSDIAPGSEHGAPDRLTAVGRTLFFTADDGVHGRELWKTDGTFAGTVMVRDVNPGSAPSAPDELVEFKGRLYFTAQIPQSDGPARVLWRSDGTAAGTVPLLAHEPGADFYISPRDLRPLGNKLYMLNGGALWQSDGTTRGTTLVAMSHRVALHLLLQGGTTLLATGTGRTSTGALYAGVWQLQDGVGVVRIQAFNGMEKSPEMIGSIDDTLLYSTQKTGSLKNLWLSSSTKTERLSDRFLQSFGGQAYHGDVLLNVNISAGDSGSGSEWKVWRTDGTRAGTKVFLDEPALAIGQLGDSIYIVDQKRRVVRVSPSGSANRTTVVTKFDDGTEFRLENVNGTLLAWADRGIVWRVDTDDTELVALTPKFTEPWPTLDAQPPYGPDFSQYSPNSVTLNSSTYQVRNDRLHGLELWRIDATTASISGRAFLDLNRDKVATANEPPLPGYRVYVDIDRDGHYRKGEPTTLTDAWGWYQFAGLAPGDYIIRTTASPTEASTPLAYNVVLGAGEFAEKNFGRSNPPGPATITGRVFDDFNEDGLLERDRHEHSLAGVTVYVDVNGDRKRTSNEPQVVTDSAGGFSFPNLRPRTYLVRVRVPEGWRVKTRDVAAVTVASSQTASVRFGVHAKATLNGTVFDDMNGNGIRDAGEPPLAGRNLHILNLSMPAGSFFDGPWDAHSDSQGHYSLAIPTGRIDVFAVVASNSERQRGNVEFFLQAGSPLLHDVAITSKATVYGTVFNDINRNGARDHGEGPVAGLLLFADINGDRKYQESEPSATTDSAGAYEMHGIPPGTNTIRQGTGRWTGYEGGEPESWVDVRVGDRKQLDFPDIRTAAVRGTVFFDENRNGKRDNGERPASGVTVFLSKWNSDLGPYSRTAISDANGHYSLDFVPLLQGWVLSLVAPTGYTSYLGGDRVDLVPGVAESLDLPLWG